MLHDSQNRAQIPVRSKTGDHHIAVLADSNDSVEVCFITVLHHSNHITVHVTIIFYRKLQFVYAEGDI